MGYKGNLVVGQSGGPTAVINNSLVGVIHEALDRDEIGGVYGMLHGIAGVLNEEFIDLRQESSRTLATLRDTPASALGTVRYKVTNDDYPRLIEVLKAYDVRYFFYIGGNDSMDTTHKINLAAQAANYELFAVGVPKTIDNDLALTDHCPGYGSAARFVASAVRNTGYDTEAMGDSGPIKLIEIMGRNAGWLTAATALAKSRASDAPHLIYLPERPISTDQIIHDVKQAYDKYGYCVAAISEGIVNENGDPVGETGGPLVLDAFGHSAKSGVVEYVSALINDRLDMRARYDKPNYLQRSFAELQSTTDREEAYLVGRMAVKAALAGEVNKMVTLVREAGPNYDITTGLAPLDQVANAERMVPDEFINEQGNGVTDAFLDYARPLIGEPLMPFARLSMSMVPKVTR